MDRERKLSNWDYRTYLQNNGKTIMNQNTLNATKEIPIVTERKYSERPSDLKQSFLNKQVVFCPSIIM